jgi:hypothetical protein
MIYNIRPKYTGKAKYLALVSKVSAHAIYNWSRRWLTRWEKGQAFAKANTS